MESKTRQLSEGAHPRIKRYPKNILQSAHDCSRITKSTCIFGRRFTVTLRQLEKITYKNKKTRLPKFVVRHYLFLFGQDIGNRNMLGSQYKLSGEKLNLT
jgi:hypothetical protein